MNVNELAVTTFAETKDEKFARVMAEVDQVLAEYPREREEGQTAQAVSDA